MLSVVIPTLNAQATLAATLSALGAPADFRPWFDMEGNASRATTALREYAGLVAYRLMGRTNALLPAP